MRVPGFAAFAVPDTTHRLSHSFLRGPTDPVAARQHIGINLCLGAVGRRAIRRRLELGCAARRSSDLAKRT